MLDGTAYLGFLAGLAAAYVALSFWVQENVGGKGRLRAIREEMTQIQLKIGEAAKKKDSREMDELFSKNMALTTEMMKLQFTYLLPLLAVLIALAAFFPLVEPETQDDARLALYDDGLAQHCDKNASDGVFSNCYALPQSAKKGAWVIDGYLLSPSNETLARNATAIYVGGGKPSDVWLQSHTQSSFLDALSGKVARTLSISAAKQNYTAGETVEIHASAFPLPSPQEKIEAVLNSGTFFHIDLPFALPLLNISRIIGSYGVFLFLVFAISITYSMGKAVLQKLQRKSG
ncbi:MAG: hypothetical protein N3E51_02570 [Candidatus Micrarchaeota archaeon]|nr:hypothetical protein [Candidatus Micrarchaeota archaeon]